MPSTRRQNAKAGRSREMDMMSDFEIMDDLLGNENVNPIERELAKPINGSISNNRVDSDSHSRKNSCNENEIRDFSHENTVPRQV